MRRPRALQHQQKAHHGNRTVTQCLMYVDSFMEEGLSRQEAVKATSKLFNIAKSNIRRWWIFYDKYGETHIIVSKKLQQLRKRYGSTRVSMNDNTIHELQRIVDAHPEYYLDELVASVARVCGVLYHPSTISRVLRRKLGYSLQVLQEVATQRNELLRESYRSALRHLLKNGHSVSSLVFIDETHKDRSASRRRRGWGKRNSGGLLIRRWFREEVRYTLIAAADINGFVTDACMNFYRNDSSREGASGTVRREDFERWVEYSLVPTLGRFDCFEDRSIVVMDNASTHMSHRVTDLIESAGAVLLYSAPYSPDLNPIEKMIHSYKSYLKRNEVSFREDHVSAHWLALTNSVSRDQAIKMFRKCSIPYADQILTSDEEDDEWYNLLIAWLIINGN